MAINDYMVPKNDETKREVKADYDDHIASLAPRSNLPKYLADLLQLGKTKQLYFQEMPSKHAEAARLYYTTTFIHIGLRT